MPISDAPYNFANQYQQGSSNSRDASICRALLTTGTPKIQWHGACRKKATARTMGNRRVPINSSNNRRHAIQGRNVGMNRRRDG
jgi:hypothetical protein